MNSDSLKAVYHNLKQLDQVSTSVSARYRQMAQEILADPSVSLVWRQAISNRLNKANHLLQTQTVGKEDSY